MRALSAAEILLLCDLGDGQSPAQRPLTLLAGACPEYGPEELAALRIGQRDALLTSLREKLFGPALRSYAECPACLSRLQFTLSISELRLAAPAEAPAELSCDGYHLRFRVPSSRDLIAATACRDLEQAARQLFEGCILDAQKDGEQVAPDELPDSVRAGLGAELNRRDPQADVRMELRCAACGHAFSLAFDIATILWSELNAQASRLVEEVATLARAFGWNEGEILALTPRRRQRYLELVSA